MRHTFHCIVSLGFRTQPCRTFTVGRNFIAQFRRSIKPENASLTSRLKIPPPPKVASATPTKLLPSLHVPSFTGIFVRCGLFTFVSANAIFLGCMIWSHENRKMAFDKKPKGVFREKLENLWIAIFGRRLRSADIFWAIAFVNMLVFLGNNSRRFGPTFLLYFANSPYSPWPARSMLLSVFSHQMFFHMFLNMYVLHNFTDPLVRILGVEQYLALFLSGGIFASFLSALGKAALHSRIPSIGASGAICAMLGAFCMLEPQAQLCIPGLVSVVPHSFTAGSAAWCILAFEACGALLLSRRSPIDHAAHLGGLLFGMYYGMEGKGVVWNKRNQVIEMWHRMIGER